MLFLVGLLFVATQNECNSSNDRKMSTICPKVFDAQCRIQPQLAALRKHAYHPDYSMSTGNPRAPVHWTIYQPFCEAALKELSLDEIQKGIAFWDRVQTHGLVSELTAWQSEQRRWLRQIEMNITREECQSLRSRIKGLRIPLVCRRKNILQPHGEFIEVSMELIHPLLTVSVFKNTFDRVLQNKQSRVFDASNDYAAMTADAECRNQMEYYEFGIKAWATEIELKCGWEEETLSVMHVVNEDSSVYEIRPQSGNVEKQIEKVIIFMFDTNEPTRIHQPQIYSDAQVRTGLTNPPPLV